MTYNKEENKLSDGTKCHISAKKVWKDGEDVTGKYKLGRGKQIDTTDQQQWQEMNNEEKDRFFERIAYPLTTQSESEDELWENIANDFVEFALGTFKKASALSSLKKLSEEIQEVAHEIQHGHENLVEEYADCFMCLFDSAARMKITPIQIKEAFARKLKINKSRTWIKNPDDTYSHVK